MDCLLGDSQRASRSQEGMTLQWSPESIHDLIALRVHIAEHDPAAAKRVALHILYCIEYLLPENPKLGAPGRVPGARELVIPNADRRQDRPAPAESGHQKPRGAGRSVGNSRRKTTGAEALAPRSSNRRCANTRQTGFCQAHLQLCRRPRFGEAGIPAL
jgi:plasmid stabilization system protein ParE